MEHVAQPHRAWRARLLHPAMDGETQPGDPAGSDEGLVAAVSQKIARWNPRPSALRITRLRIEHHPRSISAVTQPEKQIVIPRHQGRRYLKQPNKNRPRVAPYLLGGAKAVLEVNALHKRLLAGRGRRNHIHVRHQHLVNRRRHAAQWSGNVIGVNLRVAIHQDQLVHVNAGQPFNPRLRRPFGCVVGIDLLPHIHVGRPPGQKPRNPLRRVNHLLRSHRGPRHHRQPFNQLLRVIRRAIPEQVHQAAACRHVIGNRQRQHRRLILHRVRDCKTVG